MTKSNVTSSLLNTVWLVAVLFLTATKGVGQGAEVINRPRQSAPFVVVLYDQLYAEYVDSKIRSYKDAKGTSFLLIETNNRPIETVKDSINNRLNYTQGIDKRRCYILIVGGKKTYEDYLEVSNSSLFSSKYLLTEEDVTPSAGFGRGKVFSTEVREVINYLSEKYLWQIRLEEVKQQNVSDLNQNAIESGIGIRVGGVIPIYDGLETSIKPFFRTISLNVYHRWGRRWQTNLDATLGLNLPGQNKIQRQVQSAAFSDEETEVTIQAHVLTSAAIETRYLFMPENRKLNPFVGIRLGVSSISAAESTVEIDPDDISSGSFERPGSNDFETIRSPTIGLASGLQYNVSPRIMIESALRWNNDLKNITEIAEPFFNNLSFSVGFNFRFTGRKELFYDFINLKDD